VIHKSKHLELEAVDSERKAPCWCYRKRYWERTDRENTLRMSNTSKTSGMHIKHLSIYNNLYYVHLSFSFSLTVYPCYAFRKVCRHFYISVSNTAITCSCSNRRPISGVAYRSSYKTAINKQQKQLLYENTRRWTGALASKLQCRTCIYFIKAGNISVWHPRLFFCFLFSFFASVINSLFWKLLHLWHRVSLSSQFTSYFWELKLFLIPSCLLTENVQRSKLWCIFNFNTI
jgi:hypothetical protein